MSKYKNTNSKKEKYPYPSRFGSHKSMIDEEKTKELNRPDYVICTDEFGSYMTMAANLDNGLADIFRYNREAVQQKT